MMLEFKIYLTNLGKYNEGELVGKWVELPCSDLAAEFAAIGVVPGTPYEESFITDYENNISYDVREFESAEALNELAEELQEVSDRGELEMLAAYLESEGGSLRDALDNYENAFFYSGMELEDVAREIIEECYDLPEMALRYFDYKAFARDLHCEGYNETSHGVICVQ